MPQWQIRPAVHQKNTTFFELTLKPPYNLAVVYVRGQIQERQNTVAPPPTPTRIRPVVSFENDA